jgi:hypothetical protein
MCWHFCRPNEQTKNSKNIRFSDYLSREVRDSAVWGNRQIFKDKKKTGHRFTSESHWGAAGKAKDMLDKYGIHLDDKEEAEWIRRVIFWLGHESCP